jgi:hypothetical protein
MIRVRFPNGQCLQYNDATRATIQGNGSIEFLRTGSDSRLYIEAFIAPGTDCIVEYARPCSVENPISELTPNKAIAYLQENIREASHYHVRDLKKLLQDFDTRRMVWK